MVAGLSPRKGLSFKSQSQGVDNTTPFNIDYKGCFAIANIIYTFNRKSVTVLIDNDKMIKLSDDDIYGLSVDFSGTIMTISASSGNFGITVKSMIFD